MPYKAKKPCAKQGCRELTSNRFCETHAKEAMKDYNKYRRDPDSNKRYGRQWRKVREAFLSTNPVCGICEQDGRVIPAVTVHHKKKLTEGGTHAFSNLEGLCSACHSRLHASEGDYF